MAAIGYLITFSDDDYDSILPAKDSLPRVVYRSLEEAVRVLESWAKTFDLFRPALYGEAYPYENTTLAAEVAKTGRGIYGWVEMVDEDGEVTRYGLSISSVRIA